MNKNKTNLHRTMIMKHQNGLSLVELMISTVVGLFLLVGVISNFISTKNADVKRDAVSEMDANAAEAFRVLRRAISHAGYRSIENTILEDDMAFYIGGTDVPNVACRNGVMRDRRIVKTSKRTRDQGNRDYITVISLADNPCLPGNLECATNPLIQNPNSLLYSDCAGNHLERDAHSVSCSTDPDMGMENPTLAKIYSTFWIGGNNTDKAKTLMCTGSRASATDNSPQHVVSDVEAMQFIYGVKDEDGNTTFRAANEITLDNQWPMVTSVQVGLLMRSSNQYVLDQASTKTTYNLVNRNVTVNADDLRRLFRVYTTTINMENQNKGALL